MMKQLFLFVLAHIGLAAMAQAQDTRSFRKFGIGVYGGPQISGKIYTSDHLSAISGLTAGLDLRYALSKEPEGFSLHLQPGFNTFRQSREEDGNGMYYFRYDWKWQAIHVPLLIRYTISSGRVRPFAEIGPMLRIRTAMSMRGKREFCGFAGCSDIDIREDLQSGTSKDAIGLTAGAGVEVDVWKVTIPVSIRIQEGFGTTATREPAIDGISHSQLKTRTLQVSAGISF
ncbi:outer membrane beta-barrel protein [Dyadobacter sandarakinus]|uniref:Outer membrane beta-barrel protein n=1 Tax=Dyadobacter sandarakinus TaxID=2747268 RepID=A0ABX7I1P8_9BACT|nr:outer membrane beta-barrel protein [Dyadobacter sandarakinus]QRQ99854.1 outer membrane beta-barrel protein [Dyadobacter sandarakinus]